MKADTKYKIYPKIDIQDRKWPENIISKAPVWCSVDLRDGNQALIKPMNIDKKLAFFDFLVKRGFKEIEIGFPSASKVEFEFARRLIKEKRVPDDVTIQVLVQAREHLIQKTREALNGAKNVIVHLYNSTSVVQREIVFKKEKDEIIDIALQGVRWIKEYFSDFAGNLRFEYSPESFTGTELDFAAKICNAVIDEWAPKADNKMIINLPATVEMSTPNIYADQIEWMIRRLHNRDSVLISLHAHNDRGTAVAATELALMAGADRVEGTLLGNGERTGNVDIVTLALNMYTQGIDTGLDFSNVDEVVSIVEKCTEINTHIRHPYVGKMVYTAFSGSHQDAINKGLAFHSSKKKRSWEVPYLPIDPADVGRTYEDLIQINSQSGKGGVAFILEQKFGYEVPKKMQIQVGELIQKEADKRDNILSDEEILEIFENSFLKEPKRIALKHIRFDTDSQNGMTALKANISVNGKEYQRENEAKGPVEAMKKILEEIAGVSFDITDYHEHALNEGADAQAVAYIGIISDKNRTCFGMAKESNIAIASIKAMINALDALYAEL